MATVTYDQIEPNIAEVDTEGPTVKVVWKCPISGEVVGKSNATMTVDPTVTQIKTGVARTFVMSGVPAIVQSIARAFGFGSLGMRVTQAVVTPASYSVAGKMTAVKYTDAMRRKAVVAAFAAVEKQFRWDEDRGMFVKA